MKLVDVHCHLDHARFEKDLDEVIERFEEEGGRYIVSSGVNPSTNRKNLEFAKKYDVVRASFGIYPTDALACELKSGEAEGFLRDFEHFSVDEELKWIEKHADDCVAVGEVGLDYSFKDFQTEGMREKQKEVFRKVLDLTKRIRKPVVIHSRKAELDAIEILEEMGMEKVVMHCFCGKKSLIRRCVENGWSFSVPPVIARLEHFKMLVDMVPLGQLLTETDAPYLSPVVGQRNESANVVVTIGIIAEIKGLSEDEVARNIFENAVKLFGL
ncbi:TatD family hydrolase [Candidatus Pacearchaeota archaeon]|nr:TatD family hydrolase [Candidatus Pacearchaeota archaeon]